MRMTRMITCLLAALAGCAAPAAAQSAASKAVQVDTVMIELNRFGFFPTQITYQAKQHFIFINNVSGLKNLSLALKDDHGAAKKQQVLTPDSPHWREMLNLGPGTYTLTEANHPSWSCTITLK